MDENHYLAFTVYQPFYFFTLIIVTCLNDLSPVLSPGPVSLTCFKGGFHVMYA